MRSLATDLPIGYSELEESSTFEVKITTDPGSGSMGLGIIKRKALFHQKFLSSFLLLVILTQI